MIGKGSINSILNLTGSFRCLLLRHNISMIKVILAASKVSLELFSLLEFRYFERIPKFQNFKKFMIKVDHDSLSGKKWGYFKILLTKVD